MKFKNIALALLTIIAIMPAQAMWDGACKKVKNTWNFSKEFVQKKPVPTLLIFLESLYIITDVRDRFKIFFREALIRDGLTYIVLTGYNSYHLWSFYQDKLNGPLWEAINFNDLNGLKQAIAEGANPETQSAGGSLPIHSTAGQDKHHLTAYLIDSGVNINSLGSNGNTPLHTAVLNHRYNTTKYLVQQGANIHIEDNFTRTAYSYADIQSQTIADPDDIIHAIATYLKLALDYEAKRKEQKVTEFLQTITTEQSHEIFEIAMKQNNGLDLEKLNQYDSFKYSWLYKFYQCNNISSISPNAAKSIPLFMAKLGITPIEFLYIIGRPEIEFMYANQLNTADETQKRRIELILHMIKKTYNYAKKDDNKAFGRAMKHYFDTIRGLMGKKQTLPDETVYLITQFKNNHK